MQNVRIQGSIKVCRKANKPYQSHCDFLVLGACQHSTRLSRARVAFGTIASQIKPTKAEMKYSSPHSSTHQATHPQGHSHQPTRPFPTLYHPGWCEQIRQILPVMMPIMWRLFLSAWVEVFEESEDCGVGEGTEGPGDVENCWEPERILQCSTSDSYSFSDNERKFPVTSVLLPSVRSLRFHLTINSKPIHPSIQPHLSSIHLPINL